MAVSSFSSRVPGKIGHGLAAFAIAVALLAAARASEKKAVAFAGGLSPRWFATGAPSAVPAPGEILAVGELSMGDDAVADTSRLRVIFPDGSPHAVQVEQKGMVREMGRLVFCRFAIGIPAPLLGEEGFVLEYGDDVNSPNPLLPALAADPAQASAYREISLAPVPADAAESGTEEQHLQVVADRRATRGQWLFLLPVALVIAGSALGRITGKTGGT